MGELGIVVFGAAVWADGTASPTLARRVGYALQAARERADAPILCSGGIGKNGPSEASVMSRMLRRMGVAEHRIALDEASIDTLQSVLAAARFVRQHSLSGCVACSDGYHLPRIKLLLTVLSVPATSGPVESGRLGTSLAYWLTMRVREAIALPYDFAVLATRRGAILDDLNGCFPG